MIGLDEQRKILRNRKLFLSHLRIRPKKGGLVPFKLNSAQRKLDDALDKQMAETGRVRAIILKARQLGCSTYVEGRNYHNVLTNPYVDALVVAHDKDSAKMLFRMTKRFYDTTPEEMRLKLDADSRTEIALGEPIKSAIAIGTANNENLGRGSTLKYVHLSEYAKWQDQINPYISVMQAVPDEGSEVIIESTANGTGDEFHRMWREAKDGKNGFIPIFFPWFEMDEYRMKIPEHEIPAWTDEEFELKELHNLDDEQLWWRRRTIQEKCKGEKDLFKQEYPSNDLEAFIASGETVFDNNKLYVHIGALEKKPYEYKTCDIVKQGEGYVARPSALSYLKIYEEPRLKREYVIGADIGQGLRSGDYSAAFVLNRQEMTEAALFHGKMDPDMFGDFLVGLATYYNNAFVAPEVNNQGISALNRLIAKQYPYIYMREIIDSVTHEKVRRAGWETTVRTRPLLISNLSEQFRAGGVTIRSPEIYREATTFIYATTNTGKKKPEAQKGCHDDLLMALGITLTVHDSLPIMNTKMPEADEVKRHESEVTEQIQKNLRERQIGGDWFDEY